MNYRYQFGGADVDCDRAGDRVVDYSRGLRGPLDESALDERVGICGPAIDWNLDGELDESVEFNINASEPDQESNCGGGITVLSDHDDWGGLILGGLADGDGSPVPEIAVCPGPAEDDR
jgi:hypothetical protein